MATWGFILIAISLIVWLFVTKASQKNTAKMVFFGGVFLAVVGALILPAMITGPPPADGHSWSVSMSQDTTAATWDDTIVSDDDLWSSSEGSCDPTAFECTVLVTATQVAGGGQNTIAPDEFLIDFVVQRLDDDPDQHGTDDTAILYGSYFNIPIWTNTSSQQDFPIINQNANGQNLCYFDDESGNGFQAEPGESIPLGEFLPSESNTVRFGCQLTDAAFGETGQTAGISVKSINGQVGNSAFTVWVQTNAIS
jgi:hypothetical protein